MQQGYPYPPAQPQYPYAQQPYQNYPPIHQYGAPLASQPYVNNQAPSTVGTSAPTSSNPPSNPSQVNNPFDIFE